MSESIIIPNKERLSELKKSMTEGGAEKFHVLTDFDDTLTRSFIAGKKSQTSFAQVRNGGHLSPEYVKKTFEMYDYYRPIEVDNTISIEEKTAKMVEWWNRHFNLLVKHGFSKQLIGQIAGEKNTIFRGGSLELMDFLRDKNIPLVIMSAGLGDLIREIVKAEGRLYPNTHLISNFFNFDEDGKAMKYNEPLIHSLNKHETAIQGFPAFDVIKDRKNVLLMGDIIEDLGMIKGFDYDNLIRVGFLNVGVEENLEKFKENFDIIIKNDSGMEFVTNLVKEIFS